ncbi:MAG: hypothetical protein EAZ65_03670 [Verrucomicrobia bacterium]|nr:MAG: hypothetical protein EAZ84_02945 [Verrucomicrobiota bacterium]TAE88471.1 MAG: hypothetical protein EAZ82_04355 [Verrucomicrobiota bacterium]TAF26926.1 MAG: hypothetical protein EAZ71_03670 [Verrucomicrobiota bacterium]TAF42182.1 MAG: hypothetical protein EAZ65_03670 [Verrucomicrobiota bacterium]
MVKRVKSIRLELSPQEAAIVEEISALGFSSKSELIRCATLAWMEHHDATGAAGETVGTSADGGVCGTEAGSV